MYLVFFKQNLTIFPLLLMTVTYKREEMYFQDSMKLAKTVDTENRDYLYFGLGKAASTA